MNNLSYKGFSVIEVLIASFIFSITLLGLSNYSRSLELKYQNLMQQIKAERLAFALLESYPNIQLVDVPKSWQYELHAKAYTDNCQTVNVHFHLPNNKKIEQSRLICH